MAIDPNNLAATAKLTFADEFNSLSLWNGTSGVWSTNAWYNDQWNLTTSNGFTRTNNGEEQWYINDNFAGTAAVNPWTVSGGILTITAAPASPSIQSQINGYKYTSGEINSYHSFSQTYGYFEMRAQLPAGQGLWPAFWLLPKDNSWPPELDIMEVLGHNPTGLVTTVHSAVGGHTMVSTATTVADTSKGYHTYGVDWQKDFITWYFDGQAIFKTATPSDMHKPMYILANLAVGGYWPGSPNGATQFPAEYKIDYIRAYADIGATTPTAPAPVTNPGAEEQPQPSNPPQETVVDDEQAATGSVSTAQFLVAKDAGDRLFGGSGDDRIEGEGGDDYLRGGPGADIITGGGGFDDINGNEGSDTASGGAGGDWVVGGKDGDLLNGDEGDDIVYGNKGDDTVNGGIGDDTVRGGQDNDLLSGGAGDDWLSGDRGNDTISGGSGADTFHTFFGADIDRVTDFNSAEGDRVQIDLGTPYTVAQVGADTVIDMGAGGQMILTGVTKASLPAGWLVEI